MNPIKITVDRLREIAPTLKITDRVLLSGYVYTARDAAHKRFSAMIDRGEPLPFPVFGAVIYYAGPTDTPPGAVIGSCGPTTSGRMDAFTPALLDMGLAATIGKGQRSPAVVEALKRNKAVYFCALGGAGALAARCVKSCETVAFDDLGCESVKKIFFDDFPLFVAADSSGNDIFTSGREKYRNVFVQN
ncbi:MAG: FumA C-terminus/TtdB family hydratase beta subunit [Oscillospiraceae bacterium]|jgi:fumarate hydratase subunit beta|nr:FumA C-terminus/TtdB family hydratase beta subunit [Oscillospiraceae bacterium]